MTIKNHKNLNFNNYNQDYINGITKKHYNALLDYIQNIKPKTILDLAGGSGRLSILLNKKYDVYLLDNVKNLIEIAIKNGFPRKKTIIADILNLKKFNKKFDMVIMKSSMHEFPINKRIKILTIINDLLNNNGYFIDWDAYFPDENSAKWAIEWINLKDEIAGLYGLVKNRSLITKNKAIFNLKNSGFNKVNIISDILYYTLSVKKFSKIYWRLDKKKTENFYNKTMQLLRRAPTNLKYSITKKDIKIKFPLIILSAKK